MLGIENELILQLKRTIDLVDEPPRKQQAVASDEASTPSGAAPTGVVDEQMANAVGSPEATTRSASGETAPSTSTTQPAEPRTPTVAAANAGAQAVAAVSSPNEQPSEQIARLKLNVAQKREQLSALRAVLRTNKQTAEQAHAALKHKYESERTAVSDTMNKLRAELRTLKEEAATFVHLRTLFSERIDQTRSDVEEASRKLQVAFLYFYSC